MNTNNQNSRFNQLIGNVPDSFQEKYRKHFSEKSNALIPLLIFFDCVNKYGAGTIETVRAVGFSEAVEYYPIPEPMNGCILLSESNEGIYCRWCEVMHYMNNAENKTIKTFDPIFSITGTLSSNQVRLEMDTVLHSSKKSLWKTQLVSEVSLLYCQLIREKK